MSKWQHPNLLLSIKSSEPTLNAGMSRYPVVREAAGKLGIQMSEDSYNLLWCDHPLSIRDIKAQDQGTKVNHLPEVTTITRKNKLAAHLNSLRLHFPKVPPPPPRTTSSPPKPGYCPRTSNGCSRSTARGRSTS